MCTVHNLLVKLIAFKYKKYCLNVAFIFHIFWFQFFWYSINTFGVRVRELVSMRMDNFQNRSSGQHGVPWSLSLSSSSSSSLFLIITFSIIIIIVIDIIINICFHFLTYTYQNCCSFKLPFDTLCKMLTLTKD